MTGRGLQRLEDELRKLKSEERPAVIRAIAEARSHGDQFHLGAELEEIMSAVEVIDPSSLSGDHVQFGAQVKLVDEETEKEATYQIVGVYEADIKAGLLSVSAPLARSLIGKRKGDTVSVPAPGGDRTYEILNISFG